jgi:hypothetical protein
VKPRRPENKNTKVSTAMLKSLPFEPVFFIIGSNPPKADGKGDFREIL